MGGWLKNDPKVHSVRFHALSGREYDLKLVRAIKLDDDEVPLVLIENEDETYSAAGKVFGTINEFCQEYGCILTDFESVEPTAN